MHTREKTFKKANLKFNLFYLEPSENYFFHAKCLYFADKNSPYFLGFLYFCRIFGDLHFCTHSISWDPNNLKFPVLRFPYYENFNYSINKISENLPKNLPGMPASAGNSEKHGIKITCSIIENFPRNPYSAKEKLTVFFIF